MAGTTHPTITTLRKNKNIIAALIVSLLLHLLILEKTFFNNTVPSSATKILSVQLINTENPKPTNTVNIDSNSTESKLIQSQNTSFRKDTSTESVDLENPNSVAPTLEISSETSLSLGNSETQDLAQMDPSAMEETKFSEANQEASDSEISIVATTKKYLAPTYRYIEAEYEVSASNGSGSSRVMFNLDKNNTYTINEITTWRNDANSTTISKQKSNGSIIDAGIISSHYSSQNNMGRVSNILFDWAESLIIFQNGNRQQNEVLLANTYDALNYTYQFMFFEPDKENAFTIAGMGGLHPAICNLVGVEDLATPLNNLKTTRLRCHENEFKTDIWLAKDYQNFPVKLLRVDSKENIIWLQDIKTIATASKP